MKTLLRFPASLSVHIRPGAVPRRLFFIFGFQES
jgi:hypothetical protein